MTTTSADQPLMDLTAVARRLGVNQRHVRRLVAERRIPYLKWGHLLRFDPAAIDEWLRQARHDPTAPRDFVLVELIATNPSR